MAQGVNLTNIHEDTGSIPGSLSELRIRRCRELWYRSQTWLRSGMAVVVAWTSGYSSNSTSLGTSMCHGYGPKRTKDQKKKKKVNIVALAMVITYLGNELKRG